MPSAERAAVAALNGLCYLLRYGEQSLCRAAVARLDGAYALHQHVAQETCRVIVEGSQFAIQPCALNVAGFSHVVHQPHVAAFWQTSASNGPYSA